MRLKYLQILLLTSIGAYFIGATDVPDTFVLPFAAILLFALINLRKKGK